MEEAPAARVEASNSPVGLRGRSLIPEDAAALLLEVISDPGLQTRYLRDVLPLVAEVSVGRSWVETH